MDLLLVHYVRLARCGFASLLGDERDRLGSGGDVSVDDQHLRAFPGENKRCRPTVPDGGSGPFTLARPDNDRDLVL